MAAAARELNVTPSAVSHRMREIESLVGTPLFARGVDVGRNLALTVAGTHYLAQVREALDKLALLSRPRLGDPKSERLRVVAPPTFARQLLVARLAEFSRANPHIAIEFSLSIPFSDVRAVESDVEVRFGRPGDMRGDVTPLFNETIFPVASRAYIEKHGGALPWSAEHVARAELLRNPRDKWQHWFAGAGLQRSEPREGPLFNDLGLMIEAAAAGQGVALARSRLVEAWLASGAVAKVSAMAIDSPYCYCVVVTAESATPATREFCDWLVGQFAE